MGKRIWLIDTRKNKGLTQREIATLSQIERPYYTQIENGTRTPSTTVAKRIADVLSFEWTNFFENECSIKRQKIL